MKSLWFTQSLANAIISGEKRSTIRRRSGRLPSKGESVRASVGPKPPFAILTVTDSRDIDLEELDVAYQRRLQALYRGADLTSSPLTELHFVVREVCTPS